MSVEITCYPPDFGPEYAAADYYKMVARKRLNKCKKLLSSRGFAGLSEAEKELLDALNNVKLAQNEHCKYLADLPTATNVH